VIPAIRVSLHRQVRLSPTSVPILCERSFYVAAIHSVGVCAAFDIDRNTEPERHDDAVVTSVELWSVVLR